LKGKLLLQLENPLSQVQYNGEEVLFGNEHIIPYGEIYERFYKNITRGDVNAIIKKYFKPENMCVCLVSEKLPSLSQVKKEFARIAKA
jgi:predicted Zn-dependent peptidase